MTTSCLEESASAKEFAMIQRSFGFLQIIIHLFSACSKPPGSDTRCGWNCDPRWDPRKATKPPGSDTYDQGVGGTAIQGGTHEETEYNTTERPSH